MERCSIRGVDVAAGEGRLDSRAKSVTQESGAKGAVPVTGKV